MKHSSQVLIHAPTSDVLPWVSDLALYPKWMPLVHHVSQEGTDVWDVELRAKVGVFARSKRLRMERTHCDDSRIVFERVEKDVRTHSPWVLEAEITTEGSGTQVTMTLSYGGNLWASGILDRVLASQIDAGKAGLARVVQRA